MRNLLDSFSDLVNMWQTIVIFHKVLYEEKTTEIWVSPMIKILYKLFIKFKASTQNIAKILFKK